MSYNAIETSFCAAFISLVQPDGYLQEIKKRPSVLKYTDRVKNDQAYLWQTINYFCTNSSQDLRHYQPIIYRFACGFQKGFLSRHFTGVQIAKAVLERENNSPIFDPLKTEQLDFLDQTRACLQYCKTHITGTGIAGWSRLEKRASLATHIFSVSASDISGAEHDYIMYLAETADELTQDFIVRNSLLLPITPAP